MRREEVRIIPMNEWPEDAQDRLLDDVLAGYAEPKPLKLGAAFWICFAAIVAFLLGLIGGMLMDSAIKHFSKA